MFSTCSLPSFSEVVDGEFIIDDVLLPFYNSQRSVSHESTSISHECTFTSQESINTSHGFSFTCDEISNNSGENVHPSIGTTAYSSECDSTSGVTSANDETLDVIYFESRYPRTDSVSSLRCSIRTGSTLYSGPRNNPVELRPPPVSPRRPRNQATTLPQRDQSSRSHPECSSSCPPFRGFPTLPLRLPEDRHWNRPCFSTQPRGQIPKHCSETEISRFVPPTQNKIPGRASRGTRTGSKKRWRCCKRKGPKYNKAKERRKTTVCLLRKNTVWTLTGLSLVLSLAVCGTLLAIELRAEALTWDNTNLLREDSFEMCFPSNLCSSIVWTYIKVVSGDDIQCCTKNIVQVETILRLIIQESSLPRKCEKPPPDEDSSLNTKVNLTKNVSLQTHSLGLYYVYTKVHFKKLKCSTYLSADVVRTRGAKNTTLSRMVNSCLKDINNNGTATSYTGGLFELEVRDNLSTTSADEVDTQRSFIGMVRVG